MAKVDKSKVCSECLTQPRRQRKGKVFPLCDDCRPIIVGRKWKIRKLKRTLMEGALVQFHTADGGWRAGYLLKMREMRADVQPVGAIGKVPDVVVVNIDALKPEPNPSKLWPTVDDFYRANTRSKPVVLVADPIQKPSGAKKSEVEKIKEQRVARAAVQKVNFIHGEKDDATFAAKMTEHKAAVMKSPRAPKASDAERVAKDAEVYAARNANPKLTWAMLDLQIYGRVTHGNLSWSSYKREAARRG